MELRSRAHAEARFMDRVYLIHGFYPFKDKTSTQSHHHVSTVHNPQILLLTHLYDTNPIG